MYLRRSLDVECWTLVCSERQNDVNKPGASDRSRLPVDTVNIASDAADNNDVERLMRDVAAEMHIDAQQAIDNLKKDKELWNRVERLKKDAATRQRDVDEQNLAVNVDTGTYVIVLCVWTS